MTQSTYTKSVFKILNNSDVPDNIVMSSPSKISKKKGVAFSLPAGKDFSCIGETSLCAKDCYARKGNHFRHGVQQAFVNNYLFLKDAEARNDTTGAVDMLKTNINVKAGLMRIHESGDFFSQWYVDVWTQVAKDLPDVKFWFYTRSFGLDFSALTVLDNVSGWASTDDENMLTAIDFVKRSGLRHAYGPITENSVTPTNTVICPATSGKLDVVGACESCMLCVDKNKFKKNIGFLKH